MAKKKKRTYRRGSILIGTKKNRKKNRRKNKKAASKEKRDYKKEFSSACEDSVLILTQSLSEEDDDLEQLKKEYAAKKAREKKQRQAKAREKYKELASMGGLIITPDGRKLNIEPGEDPIDSLQQHSPGIAKNYDYALRFLQKAKESGGEITEAEWGDFQEMLLRRGWIVAFAGEVISRRFDDRTVGNLHKYILELDWPDDTQIKLTRAGQTKPEFTLSLEDLLDIESRSDLTKGKLVAVPGKSKRVRQKPEEESLVDESLALLEDDGMSDKWRSVQVRNIKKYLPKVGVIKGRSFNQLVRGSERGRRVRARNVRTKPPSVAADDEGNEVLIYNFKSMPSTTGKRQRGYARFYKPEKSKAKTLGNLPVEVSCSCPDFKYRWEVANKRVGSSQIFHSNGKKPNKTNPTMRPGLCKHLLALGNYIRGVKIEPS